MESGLEELVDTSDNFRTVGLPEDESWTPERRREWEANVFASALLMDAEALRQEWRGCKDPTKLAWIFQVSTTAMVVRLTQLGLLEQLD